MRAFARAALEAARAARWWAGEFFGDHAYAHYRERHAREHPGEAPLAERDFWRAREREAEGQASEGCC